MVLPLSLNISLSHVPDPFQISANILTSLHNSSLCVAHFYKTLKMSMDQGLYEPLPSPIGSISKKCMVDMVTLNFQYEYKPIIHFVCTQSMPEPVSEVQSTASTTTRTKWVSLDFGWKYVFETDNELNSENYIRVVTIWVVTIWVVTIIAWV